jgi:glucosamine--fructose-6-phosphate aminotransferase (isomerizing)
MALKIEEAVRIPAVAYRLETVLHGHLVAHDGRDGFVLFVTDPESGERGRRRAVLAAHAIGRLSERVAAIVSGDADAAMPAELTPVGRIVVPSVAGPEGTVTSLTGSAIPLQLVTLGMVHEAGVNPDLIRREEAPYREVAQRAKEDEAW